VPVDSFLLSFLLEGARTRPAFERSVASVAAWWFDGGEVIEIELGYCLQSLGGGGAAQSLGQAVGPGSIVGLERDQLGDGIIPPLWPGTPIRWSLIADRRSGLLGLMPSTIARLPFGTAECMVALWLSAYRHGFISVT